MASNWQKDAEDTWTLRGDAGEILAAVSKHGDRFEVSGLLAEDVSGDFTTLEEPQQILQRRQEQRLAES